MKKITFIITCLSTGGAEMMLLKIIENIDVNIFEISVISLTNLDKIGQKIQSLGIPVFTLQMKSGLPSPRKLLQLIQILHSIKPDIVQTWMYHADFLGGLAARIIGIPAIVWNVRHNNLSQQMTKRSTLMIVKLCAFLSKWVPQRILTCSSQANDVHMAVGYDAQKMSVIPNGFNLSLFQPDKLIREMIRSQLNIPIEAPLIGIIARHHPLKNHIGFIQMAEKIHQHNPHTHFLLAGAGVDKMNSTLMNAIGDIGLKPSFHLLGRRDDIPDLMASLDVLVSPSHGEAFPNVLGEAMACEVPCVVTDVGDSAEIVGPTGRVVSAGDMDGLAKQVIELLSLPAEDRAILGKAARQRVQENYDIKNIVQQYEALYKSLIREDSICAD